MSNFVKHNVNNRVKVKLTEKGQEILDDRYSKFNLINHKQADKDGYTSFQMHELMNIFGEYMILGYTVPFDTQILVQASESGEMDGD